MHFRALDGWALEEWIETLSGGVTLSGDPVVSDYAQFQIESETASSNSNTEAEEIIWQPDTGDDTGHVTVIAGAPGHPELDSVPGPLYTLRPESVYAEPQRVGLTLHAGADATNIAIY